MSSGSLFSFVSREDEDEEAVAEFTLITISDSSMSMSPPVDLEEGGASGMSLRACTAG